MLAEVREIIGDDIEIEFVHQRHRPRGTHSRPARRRGEATRSRRTIRARRVFPYLLSGGTDNKALAELGIAGYGFAPLRLPADLDFPAMFHGVDERVPLDALVLRQAGSCGTCCSATDRRPVSSLRLPRRRKADTTCSKRSSSVSSRDSPSSSPSPRAPTCASSASSCPGARTRAPRSPRSRSSAPRLAVVVFFWRDIVRIISHWFGSLFGRDPAQRPRRADGLAHHRRLDPDRRARHPVPGRDRDDVPLALDRRDHAHRLRHPARPRRLGRREEAARSTSSRSRTASSFGFAQALALDPRRLPLGRHHHGRALPRLRAPGRGALRVPARHPRGLRQRLLPARVKSLGRAAPCYGPIETAAATVVAFVVAILVIAFFMNYISRHSFLPFVIYRILLGGTIFALLATGVIDA